MKPPGIGQRITEPVAVFLQPIFIELVSVLLYRIQIDFRSDGALRIEIQQSIMLKTFG